MCVQKRVLECTCGGEWESEWREYGDLSVDGKVSSCLREVDEEETEKGWNT